MSQFGNWCVLIFDFKSFEKKVKKALDKETGFIFSPKSEKEMTDAIVLLYKNPALRYEMGNRNIERAKSFSLDIALNSMAVIYGDLISFSKE